MTYELLELCVGAAGLLLIGLVLAGGALAWLIDAAGQWMAGIGWWE